jgi:hypothetical protein
MKISITYILLLISFWSYSQADTLLSVEIKTVKTDDLNTYYIFDSIPNFETKTILIKYLWIENMEMKNFEILEIGFKGIVLVDPIGPSRQIVENDTIHFRGHGVPRPSFFISGLKLENGFENVEIAYYHLKEIKQ